MKELLTSIIGKEDELKTKAELIQKEANGILDAAKQKIIDLSDDFEKKFQDEKEQKTKEVIKTAAQYDDKLKKQLDADLRNSKSNLENKKEKIKSVVLKTFLEE